LPIYLSKRAAICAALFVFVAAGFLLQWPMWPVHVPLIAAAYAKMPVDRLTIEPAVGGAAIPFVIEVAKSDQEKSVGLMYRAKLADTEGMLFPYGAAQNITMWMRNTYIPLDMVFIRADGTIHRIEVRAEPLSERIISSGAPVSAVLELAGGAAGRLGIKAGDKVRHGIFDAVQPPK
jgi:uncharacterized protein